MKSGFIISMSGFWMHLVEEKSFLRKNKYNTGLYVQSEKSIILFVFCVKQQLEDTAGKQNNHISLLHSLACIPN